MRASFRFRIRILLSVIVLAGLFIIARLYFIQIIHGKDYAEKANRQFASGGNKLFDRGSIYFTRKDGTLISAATLATGFLVAINPQTLTNPERAYSTIISILPSSISREEFFAAAQKKSRVNIDLIRHVSDTDGRALAAKNIPGVKVLNERWRNYPGQSLASQSLGIISYGSGDTLAGRTGLEAKYDSTLMRSGDSLYKNFFSEIFSNVSTLLSSPKNSKDGDIVTTIEPEVQTRLEEILAKLNEKYSSEASAGIIMDSYTGEIRAMARYPSFDGNVLTDIDPAILTNPFVEHIHEFGSIMKPLTMTVGFDTGVITPETTYNDTGCTMLNKRKFCNWNKKAYGVIPVEQIIFKSLNVGSAWIATQIGQEKFRDYFTKLFGQKTDIDLPNEIGAMLGNIYKPQQIEYATASFGQGIAVTPIQMIRAVGAIANNGEMVQPHLVSAIRLDSGIERKLDWSKKVRVFSAESTHKTIEMMRKAADESLLNGKAKIPTMSVAVKTGTAQLVDERGGYSPDKVLHSFVGFFPAHNSRFIILIYTNNPKIVRYASDTLTPPFFDMVNFLIEYYGVPPDRGLQVVDKDKAKSL